MTLVAVRDWLGLPRSFRRELVPAARGRPITSLLVAGLALVTAGLGFYSAAASQSVVPIVGLLLLLPALTLADRHIGISRVDRVSITSFFFLSYIPMIYLPSFIVFADNPGPFRLPFFVAVLSALLAIPIGAAIANSFMHADRAEWASRLDEPITRARPSRALFAMCVLACVFMIGSIALYFVQVGESPLIYALRYPGCDFVLKVMREESFKLIDPRFGLASGTALYYLYLGLWTIVDPFVVALLFGYVLTTRDTKWIGLFILAFAVTGFYAASSLARTPLAALVLRLFFVYYLLHAGRVSLRSATMWALAVAAFPIFVTALAYRPGLPPADCGPEANRAPITGRIALTDPYLVLATPAAVATATPRTSTGVTASASAAASASASAGASASANAASPVAASASASATAAPSRSPGSLIAVGASQPPRSEVARIVGTVDAVGQVIRRLSYTTAFGLYEYFVVFPADHDFLYGDALIKPIARLFGSDFYVENYVFRQFNPTDPLGSGHENAAFQSNLYADFGLPGVIVGSLAVGILIQAIQIHVMRRSKTVIQLATIAALTYAFWVLNSGSVTSVLITNGALPVLLAGPILLVAERLLRRIRMFAAPA